MFNLGLDFPKRSDSVFIEINRNGGSVSNYQNYITHLNANDGTTLWFSHLVKHLAAAAAVAAAERVFAREWIWSLITVIKRLI